MKGAFVFRNPPAKGRRPGAFSIPEVLRLSSGSRRKSRTKKNMQRAESRTKKSHCPRGSRSRFSSCWGVKRRAKMEDARRVLCRFRSAFLRRSLSVDRDIQGRFRVRIGAELGTQKIIFVCTTPSLSRTLYHSRGFQFSPENAAQNSPCWVRCYPVKIAPNCPIFYRVGSSSCFRSLPPCCRLSARPVNISTPRKVCFICPLDRRGHVRKISRPFSVDRAPKVQKNFPPCPRANQKNTLRLFPENADSPPAKGTANYPRSLLLGTCLYSRFGVL